LSDVISEKKRILCVEDDPDTCDLLTFFLSDYQLVFSDGVQKTLEIFRTGHFHLCILDNRLRDGLGLDLCLEIRAMKPSVPVIFASGVAYQSEIDKAFVAGAQAYLVKPYSLEELQKVVKELIENHS
jgi:DNA-binding response OmpR family regulator